MNSKKTILTIKDHSVSEEEFQLRYNEELEMLETFPQPNEEKLSEYYKSEDYISHTDAKRNLFERAYHLIRSVTLRKKVKLINSFSDSSKKLLDIGCGTGDFLQEAKNKGWDAKGVEPNKDARTIANSKTNNQIFDVNELLSFKENSFDVITLWHVLEHLPKLNEQLDLFKKLLKQNGALIIAVPNHKSFDASYYKSFWAAYDVPRHLWHFSQASIKNLFQRRGMEVVKTLPMKFDSYYVSLLSEKYKTGKMNFIKAFLIGLRSNIKAKSSGEYSSLVYVVKNK